MTENNIERHTRRANQHYNNMFRDRDSVTGADVASSWRMSVSVSESSCQTMPSTTAEVSCQAREAASSETQTDAGEEIHEMTRDSEEDVCVCSVQHETEHGG